MEVLAEVLDTGISQGVVVVLPRELGLDELLRVQGLESLDDLQVRDIDLVVLGGVEVLLGNQDTVWCIPFRFPMSTVGDRGNPDCRVQIVESK